MKFIAGFILFFCSFATATSQDLDSLKTVLEKSKKDDYANTAKIIATTYLRQNLYDSADKYFDIAIEEGKRIKDYELTGKCFNNKGVSNYLRGRYKEAVLLYQDAISYYEKTNNDTLVAKGKTNLGLTFKGLNVYEKALQNLYEGAKVLEKLGFKKELSSNWNAIGNIHRELNNSALSLEYLNKSLSIRQQINYEKGIAQSFQNIGIWYLREREYDSAYQSLLKAYEILSVIDVRTSSATLAKLGEVMFNLDSIEIAESYFHESLKIRRELGNKNGIAVSSNHLARLYLEVKRMPEAFSNLQVAQEYGSLSNSLDEMANTQSLMQEYYTINQDYQRALQHANKLADIRKEILDKEKTKSLMEAEIRYEVDRKEQEISGQAAELSILKLRTTWLITIIIALMTIIVVFIWLYVISKRLAKERRSAKERVERLLKELHHRTKNHLQGQLGLIKLQSSFLKDSSARDIMSEVGNRMKAVTLIHQSLYAASEETAGNINLSEYLKNLTENLMITYKYTRNKISLQYDFQDVDMDIYYAVPIGLILNEAITNSFKYAYSESNSSPELNVTLRQNQSNLVVSVQDNGNGFDVSNQSKDGSFGMKIMYSLADELNAELKIENDIGVKVVLDVPLK